MRLRCGLVLVLTFGFIGPAWSISATRADSQRPSRAITVLAAGDSFTSGHGTPGATLDPCHTSQSAWPYKAIQYAGLPIVPNSFAFNACSGAQTTDFDTQWDHKTAHDLVMFTFGGDNVDFGRVMLDCLEQRCPSDAAIRDKIATVRASYQVLLDKAVSATTPGGNILVLGYPDILSNPDLWSGWASITHVCDGIWFGNADKIRGWAGDLNATIGQEVADFSAQHPGTHVTFLNVDDRLVTSSDAQYLWEPAGLKQVHTLCGNGQPWLNSLNPGDLTSSYRISFHPDAAGLDAEGHLAANAIRRMDWSGLAAPAPASNPPITKPSAGMPSVLLAQGPAAANGFRYAVTLRGFPLNTTVTISCRDSVSPSGFFAFNVETDGAGTAHVENQCFSGDGPDHWVVANGQAESNHVQWGSASAEAPSAAPVGPTTPRIQPPPPALASITASLGGPYGCSGCSALNVQVHNFPAGTYTYYCHDNGGPGGSDTVFFSHAVSVTDPSESSWPGVFCYDSAPYLAYLVMDGLTSNSVQFGASAPPPLPPTTYSETSGGVLHTWTNYTNAGGTQGPSVPSNEAIQIACKLTGFKVSDGNTWWYRVASSPWSRAYYASADGFYNNGRTSGTLSGTPFVDPNVGNC
jgi:hypothetical protein